MNKEDQQRIRHATSETPLTKADRNIVKGAGKVGAVDLRNRGREAGRLGQAGGEEEEGQRKSDRAGRNKERM